MTIQCPDANPCDHCGEIIVPHEAHRCNPDHFPQHYRPHVRAKQLPTDVDANGTWGIVVALQEDNR